MAQRSAAEWRPHNERIKCAIFLKQIIARVTDLPPDAPMIIRRELDLAIQMIEDEFAREMGQASAVGSGADELSANEAEFVGEEEFALKGRGLAGGGIGQKEDEENSSSQHEEGPDEFWSVG